MTGAQLRSNLEVRIRWYQSETDRLLNQLRTPNRAMNDDALYPDSVLEGEISRAERRIEALTFIRDYIVADEVYLLGEFDLRFADLLPDEDWDPEDLAIRARAPAFPAIDRL